MLGTIKKLNRPLTKNKKHSATVRLFTYSLTVLMLGAVVFPAFFKTEAAYSIENISIYDARVTIDFDQDIKVDSHGAPDIDNFSVDIDDTPQTIENVSIFQDLVYVDLDDGFGQTGSSHTVTVSYTKPADDDFLDNPLLLEADDSAVDSFTDSPVTVETPTLIGYFVFGDTLRLRYDHVIDATSVPANGDFSVEIDSVADPVSAVAVNDRYVDLTLTTGTVNTTDPITIDYTPGVNPIRNEFEVEAGALTDQEVLNAHLCTTVGDVNDWECAILFQFYEDTNGGSWSTSTNWLTNTTVNNWYGITTGTSRVRQIVFSSSNGLEGRLPPYIYDLTGLNQLNFSNQTDFNAQFYPEVENCSAITHIYGSNWSGPLLKEFYNSGANINFIDTSNSNLNGQILPEVGNSSIRYFHTVSNDFSGPIPSEITTITNLDWFYLRYNHLSGELPADIGDISAVGLQRFYVNHNKLGGAIPASFQNIGTGNIDLSNNMLYDDGLDAGLTAYLATNESNLATTNIGAPQSLANTANTNAVTWSEGNGGSLSDSYKTYYVYVGSSMGGPYTLDGTVAATESLEYEFSGLTEGGTYYVKVNTYFKFPSAPGNTLFSEDSDEVSFTYSKTPELISISAITDNVDLDDTGDSTTIIFTFDTDLKAGSTLDAVFNSGQTVTADTIGSSGDTLELTYVALADEVYNKLNVSSLESISVTDLGTDVSTTILTIPTGENLADNSTVSIDTTDDSVVVGAPVLKSLGVTGSTETSAISMTYNSSLNEASVPSTSDFLIRINDIEIEASSIDVTGKVVTVTVDTPTVYSDAVTLSYVPGVSPIKNNSDLNAPNVFNAVVTNQNIRPRSSSSSAAALSSQYGGPTISERFEAAFDKYAKFEATENSLGEDEGNAPHLTYSEATGSIVSLYFSETLNPSSVPQVDEFELRGNNSEEKYEIERMSLDRGILSILLMRGVDLNDTYLILSYDGDNNEPLEDLDSNNVGNIDEYEVPVFKELDSVPPIPIQAVLLDRDTVEWYFNEPLEDTSEPATEAFSVLFDGVMQPVQDVTVENIEIEGCDGCYVGKVTINFFNRSDSNVNEMKLSYNPESTEAWLSDASLNLLGGYSDFPIHDSYINSKVNINLTDILLDGDENNDGIPDSLQSNVMTVISPSLLAPFTLEVNGGVCEDLISFSLADESKELLKEDNLSFPFGFFDIKINCDEAGAKAELSITTPITIDPEISSFKKYNAALDSLEEGEDLNLSVTNFLGDSGKVYTRISYDVTDGGPHDTDLEANGIIVDPAGLGIPSAELNDFLESMEEEITVKLTYDSGEMNKSCGTYFVTADTLESVKMQDGNVTLPDWLRSLFGKGKMLSSHEISNFTKKCTTDEAMDMVCSQWPEPILKTGDYGTGNQGNKDVFYLQRYLNVFEGTNQPLVTDGKFGRQTKRAVERVQEKYSVENTGVWDSITSNRLKQQMCGI